MEKKIDYHLKSMNEIERIAKAMVKPRLLLHSCCAPCSTYTLLFLCPVFAVTIYFNNSNIYPASEYQKRLSELQRFLEAFEEKSHHHVDLIVPRYDNDAYNLDLEPYADLPEGSKRCLLCYEKRMDEAYRYAQSNGYDYFTTSMTISRQKNSQILNAIGQKLAFLYPKTKYFYSDFKKDRGIDIAREMRDEYGLYQQLYCGCKYSFLRRNSTK